MKYLFYLIFISLSSCVFYEPNTEYVGFECLDNKGCDVYQNKHGIKFYKCHEEFICEGAEE